MKRLILLLTLACSSPVEPPAAPPQFEPIRQPCVLGGDGRITTYGTCR